MVEVMREFLGMTIGTRAYNCLQNANIKTRADLERMTRRDLLRAKNLGMRSAIQIIDEARRVGIELREMEPGRSNVAIYASRSRTNEEQSKVDFDKGIRKAHRCTCPTCGAVHRPPTYWGHALKAITS